MGAFKRLLEGILERQLPDFYTFLGATARARAIRCVLDPSLGLVDEMKPACFELLQDGVRSFGLEQLHDV